jgi:hypothetical protein
LLSNLPIDAMFESVTKCDESVSQNRWQLASLYQCRFKAKKE